MSGPPISVVLADDNPAILDVLIDMLPPTYSIQAALPNGRSVLDRVDILNPELIVTDISLGDMTGFEVVKRLKTAGSTAKIIFLTVHENADLIRAAFELGVSGYVFKSRISSDLMTAMDIVAKGGQFIPVI